MSMAETNLIFEKSLFSMSRMDANAHFEINKELNRAWVNVVLSEWGGGGDSVSYEEYRVKIEGLSYDPLEKQIILERNGERIICGKIYNRRFVIDQGRSIKLTNRCKFEAKFMVDKVDDGFEIKDVDMVRVYMTVE
jgi:hypothetical protein